MMTQDLPRRLISAQLCPLDYVKSLRMQQNAYMSIRVSRMVNMGIPSDNNEAKELFSSLRLTARCNMRSG